MSVSCIFLVLSAWEPNPLHCTLAYPGTLGLLGNLQPLDAAEHSLEIMSCCLHSWVLQLTPRHSFSPPFNLRRITGREP